jgi:hypothetical protein
VGLNHTVTAVIAAPPQISSEIGVLDPPLAATRLPAIIGENPAPIRVASW